MQIVRRVFKFVSIFKDEKILHMQSVAFDNNNFGSKFKPETFRFIDFIAYRTDLCR